MAAAASARARAAGLIAAASLLVVLNGINAFHKGGDFDVYVDAGTRLLQGRPLYESSGVAAGVIGPPFQAVLFAPFAAVSLLSPGAARLCWYLINVMCLIAGVVWWRRAIRPVGPPGATRSMASVVLPLLAVGYPLQTNFEHQNMNPVLLAVVGLAAWRGSQGRTVSQGVWLGAAGALKVFPLFLLAVLAARGAWRALAWASCTVVALTLLPLVRYAPAQYVEVLADWWAISGSGEWPIRRHNQSLFAMLGRYFSPADLLTWGPIPDTASPAVHTLWLTAAVILAGFVLWAIRSWKTEAAGSMAVALAGGLGVAVVLSPIAWEHYWLLLWPAFAIAYEPPPGAARWTRPAFWAAAALTSAITPATAGRLGVALARGLSARTWGALLLIATTLAVYAALRRAGAQRL